jgi:phage baseplate assembly protein gpV
MGNQNISLALGNQTTLLGTGSQNVEALLSINQISTTINLLADTAINITAPTINLTGVVNITGALTVDGMVPMLIPV